MVRLLRSPNCAGCSFARGNLSVRIRAGPVSRVFLPTVRLFLKAHGGPSPGFEIQHLVPVSTVGRRNSILFQELELVSLGVCKEHVPVSCC